MRDPWVDLRWPRGAHALLISITACATSCASHVVWWCAGTCKPPEDARTPCMRLDNAAGENVI